MPARHVLPPRRVLLGALLILPLALAACGSDDNGSGPGAGDADIFIGIVSASDGTSGSLALTFVSPPGRGAVNATGTLKRAGLPDVAVTGDANGTTVTASGGGFTFTGTLANGAIGGSFTVSGGAGGTFQLLGTTDATTTIAFCGDYAGDGGSGPEAGTFNVVVGASRLYGTAVDEDGDALQFTGTRSAATITVQATSTAGSLSATGTINGDDIGGDYTTRLPNGTVVTTGSWSGVRCS